MEANLECNIKTLSHKKEKKVTAGKIVLWVKALVIKPDDLSLVLELYMLRTDSWGVVGYALNPSRGR